jgi:hypothetical protein
MEKEILLEVCDSCGSNETQSILLKYPFTAVYKRVGTIHENAEENTFLCLECLTKDTLEWHKESMIVTCAVCDKDINETEHYLVSQDEHGNVYKYHFDCVEDD